MPTPDEINRAPAKVQAALLEAMEERQATVAGTTHQANAEGLNTDDVIKEIVQRVAGA